MTRTEITAFVLFAVGVLMAMSGFTLMQLGWRGLVAMTIVGAFIVAAIAVAVFIGMKLNLFPTMPR